MDFQDRCEQASKIYGTARAALTSLAATIAAGIEASPDTTRWLPEEVAARAVEVAMSIVAIVAPP